MIPGLIEWPVSIFCTSSSNVQRTDWCLLQFAFDSPILFARGLFIVALWIYVYFDFRHLHPHLSLQVETVHIPEVGMNVSRHIFTNSPSKNPGLFLANYNIGLPHSYHHLAGELYGDILSRNKPIDL